jgi:hypothetical protein
MGLSVIPNAFNTNNVSGKQIETSEIVLSDPNIKPVTKTSNDFYEKLDNIESERIPLIVQLRTDDWNKSKKIFSRQGSYFSNEGNLKLYNSDKENIASFKVYKNELYKINRKAILDFQKQAQYEYEIISSTKYSPFIKIFISKSALPALLESENVLSIKLFNFDITEQEGDIFCVIEGAGCSTPPTDPPVDPNDIVEPFETVNLGDAHFDGYTGSGIRIGIIDVLLVQPNQDLLPQSRVVLDPTSPISFHSHPTLTALIAAGEKGIASDATIYSTIKKTDGLHDEFNWFIENDVSVVNISLSVGGSCSVTYDNVTTQYVDYVVRAYFISVTTSSGNNTCDNENEVTRPGLGSNVITVGGTNNSGTEIHDDSNYIEANGEIDKPNLVAPFGPFGFDEFINFGADEGTSFSVAMVTGAIALLQQKYPDLKYKPHMINAMLMASADDSTLTNKGSLTQSGLFDLSGAGILDIDRLLYDVTVAEWIYTNNSISFNINLISYGEIKIVSTWLRNQHFTQNVEDSIFLVEVTKVGTSTTFARTLSYGNVSLLEFEIPASGFGLYEVTITAIDSNGGNYVYTENINAPNNYVYGATAIFLD